MSRIARLLAWFWSLLPWPDRRWKAVHVADLPEKLRPRKVYLVGETGHVWQAAMLCPCGCGVAIQLCVLPASSPSWAWRIHDDGCVSLHPSVNRHVGCGSHFFLRLGRISWCK